MIHSIEVLVTPGCPHAEGTVELVRNVAAQLAPESDVQVTTVSDTGEAVALEFPGSPVRVDGMDLDGPDVSPPAAVRAKLSARGEPGAGPAPRAC